MSKFHVSHVQTSYAYCARPLCPIFLIFGMHMAWVPKNTHAKFQDQQSKGVDATEPQS